MLPVSALKTSTRLVSRVPEAGRPARRGRDRPDRLGPAGLRARRRDPDAPRPRARRRGRDVRQLERRWRGAGFSPGSVDGRYDARPPSARWPRCTARTTRPRSGRPTLQADATAHRRGGGRGRPRRPAADARRAADGGAGRDARRHQPGPARRRRRGRAAPAGARRHRHRARQGRRRPGGDRRRAAERERGRGHARPRRRRRRRRRDHQAGRRQRRRRRAGRGAAPACGRAGRHAAQRDRDAARRRRAARSTRSASRARDLTAARADRRGGPGHARASPSRKARSDGRRAARQLALADAETAATRARRSRSPTRKLALARRRACASSGGRPTRRCERRIVESAAQRGRPHPARARAARAADRRPGPRRRDPVLPDAPGARRLGARCERGSQPAASVMTVSNSRLAIDSSLSVRDAKLVRRGLRVTIEEPDLGVKISGTGQPDRRQAGHDADRPRRHDPPSIRHAPTSRCCPRALRRRWSAPRSSSSIAVESTKGKVLAVPIGALSVAADGSSRSGRRPAADALRDGAPGLAAQGFVEVTGALGGRSRGGRLGLGRAQGADRGRHRSRPATGDSAASATSAGARRRRAALPATRTGATPDSGARGADPGATSGP